MQFREGEIESKEATWPGESLEGVEKDAGLAQVTIKSIVSLSLC